MYLTNLRVVNRISPVHLEAVLDEQERQVVVKGWLLDDALPVEDVIASPVQRFFRTAAQRKWLDAATGDLLTLFVLDAYLEESKTTGDAGSANEPPGDTVIDVLVADRDGTGPFVIATHEIARLFDIRLDALPVLVLYTSTRSFSYVVVSLQDLATEDEVKLRCATVIQELRAAATDVFGPTRTAALAARAPAPPITAEEGELILDRLRGKVGASESNWPRWIAIVTGANTVYTLIEHVAKVLRHFWG